MVSPKRDHNLMQIASPSTPGAIALCAPGKAFGAGPGRFKQIVFYKKEVLHA